MKILSSFTHLRVVPNLYEFLTSAEHKRRYFEEYWLPLTRQLNGKQIYYGSQWGSWTLTLFKISSFVFSRRKKFIQV